MGKKITNEDLAAAIAELGQAVGGRFDKVDERMGALEANLGAKIGETQEVLARALKDVDLRLSAHILRTHETLEEHEDRLAVIEDRRSEKDR